MIKLLWNTHKQITNQTNTKNNQDATNHKWGIYHKKSSDKWIFEILENIKYQVIEDEQQIESTDILIIVDSFLQFRLRF